jgi:hypothetical protein
VVNVSNNKTVVVGDMTNHYSSKPNTT